MDRIKPEWLALVHAALSAFAEIPAEEWERACSSLRHLHLKKGEYFIRSGDVPDKMACIVSGIFRIFYTSPAGEERTLAIRSEGRMLSAFSAFLEHTLSWYDIQALEDSDLLYVSLDQYTEGLKGHVCWQAINARYAQMLFMEKERRESELLSDDAETRYRKFRERFPGVEDRIRQYHVASYLGITPVALSRIRKKLREK
ncbi:MAG TPA: Crp/Fnr family transcriptional regulator [Syntrophorhabdales bacterium]|nr:Crp/Fnr family transcriptional regulator [Syntrophorhabdales bacterium]